MECKGTNANNASTVSSQGSVESFSEVSECTEPRPTTSKRRLSQEFTEELRRKLEDLPEVIALIEKLQKVIKKQVKKIAKWKTRARRGSEKKSRNVATQTRFKEQPVENGLKVIERKPVLIEQPENKSLADDIREAAEEALQSSGFVYEETSGLYYDYNSGYYYNAEYGLYYDGTTGTYLKYNQDSQTYDFHSQVALETSSSSAATNHHQKRRNKGKSKPKKGGKRLKKHRRSGGRDQEEGECSDSTISSQSSGEQCQSYPPCMRMIVESTEIPKIKIGSLFIVTCDGGTVGREGTTHSICLPDINVSKHHLKITYDTEKGLYLMVDLGSRNGTLLNGRRMASSKQESEPMTVAHGSRVQLGTTTLLCHIHEGTRTCGHCEPGLLIEDEKDPPVMTGSKQNLNQQYKSELKRLRKQLGIAAGTGGGDDASKLGDNYTDRAQKRRQEVGSQNPYEKTKTASLEESIPAENKGFKLLAKMGWKEGQALGKDGSTGMTEPIQLVSNVGTTGIGAPSSDVTPQQGASNAKQTIWKKAQERFGKLPETAVFDDNETSDKC